MTYSTNQLNPEQGQRPKRHDDLFDDSDSSEEIIETTLSSKTTKSGQKTKKPASTKLVGTKSSKEERNKTQRQQKSSNQEILEQLQRRIQDLQSHIDSELKLSGDVETKGQKNSVYSKQNILDRMMKEDDEDQERLAEIKRQQSLLLVGQKKTNKSQKPAPKRTEIGPQKPRQSKKKKPVQEVEDWESDSDDDGMIYNVEAIKEKDISSLKEKMQLGDKKSKSSKVEIDF